MLNVDRARVSAAFLFLMSLALPTLVAAQTGTISTVAGTILSPGFSGDGGPATSAKLSVESYGVAVDAAGNVYIADTKNQRIRKVTNGIIDTIAGTGGVGYTGDGGSARNATFNNPLAVAVDSVGNVYVSDQNNDAIRKITPGGIISTFVGSLPIGANFDGDTPKSPTQAHLSHPFGVAVDSQDNLYIADTGNMRIRKVTKSTGLISTVAGSGGPTGGTGGGLGGFRGDGGAATSALLAYPSGVAVDSAFNVYIADDCNQRIRKVTAGGTISTFAGSTPLASGTGATNCKTAVVSDYSGDGGAATNARLSHPYGVAVDAAGVVYIADYYNFVIRKVATNGIISTYAGVGGQSGASVEGESTTTARLGDPVGVAVDAAGLVYIMDQSSFRVRKVTPNAAVTPPATPSGLAIVQTGSNTAMATWNAVSGATSYQLKVSFTSGAPKSLMANVTQPAVGIPGLTPGQPYYFTVTATNAGGPSADSSEVFFIIPRSGPRANDLDNDQKTDPLVWRPGNGTFTWLSSSTNYSAGGSRTWGGSGDVPFSADLDGDGLGELIVWRPSNGTWYWLTSSSNYFAGNSKAWGGLGDVPMVADMDGDGKADLAIWRPSTGTFWWLNSSSNFTTQGGKAWGGGSDKPLLADFDGDGKADPAIFRPSTGWWYWLKSSSNYTTQGQLQWGGGNDIPVLGDIDGDGKSEITVFRPSTGVWYWAKSSSGYTTQGSVAWGGGGDVPLLSDFDGDGRADVAVYRPSTATWYWVLSTTNNTAGKSLVVGSPGQGDKPVVK
jgi:VCBS repeat protein/fibronectin type III domain protein/NHL repeat-containing protein